MTDKTLYEHIIPDQNIIREAFEKFSHIRHLIVNELKNRLEQILTAIHSSPVVSGRHKSFASYYTKYMRFLKNGIKNPQITDIMGIRIICPFIEDLDAAEKLISKHFNIIETERKGHYTFKEFGYESTHLLIKIPQDIISVCGCPGIDVAEIQIRTILQDAWAEVEHELVYKAEFSPFDEPMKRKLAAVNASLSLADIIFQEIRSYQRKLSGELEKRRESFYNKIEESTDDLIFASSSKKESEPLPDADITVNRFSLENVSIDDLLVNALTAHNQNRFNDAIMGYTKILELNPDDIIRSLIYKHRGMAHFACSQYNEAIEDFDNALAFDSKSYKAVYYRGVVRSVLKQYLSAIDDFTLAISINPYHTYCLFRRGQAYYHIGDYPSALSDCEKSLAIEPDNPAAARFKEILLRKMSSEQ